MAATQQKLKGTVKSIKRSEGFGFLTHIATGTEYFFHRTAVMRTSQVGWEQIERDQEVEFTPVDAPKGPRAIEVFVFDMAA